MNIDDYNLFALPLTKVEAMIMDLLVRREIASRDAIMAVLYEDRTDGGPHAKIIDVFICHMRRKLDPLGIRIQTRRGQGYFMDVMAKARIFELCRKEAAA